MQPVKILAIFITLAIIYSCQGIRLQRSTSLEDLQLNDHERTLVPLWLNEIRGISKVNNICLGPDDSILIIGSSSDVLMSSNESGQIPSQQDSGHLIIEIDDQGVQHIIIDAKGSFYPTGICYCATNARIYITGGFICGTVDFDPTQSLDEHSGLAQSNFFLSCYSIEGQYIWSETWNGAEGVDLICDKSGNVYVLGHYGWKGINSESGAIVETQSDLIIEGYNQSLQAKGSLDCFLIKYNMQGEVDWIRTWGGEGEDIAISLALIDDSTILTSSNSIAPYPWNALPRESESRIEDIASIKAFNIDGSPQVEFIFEGSNPIVVSAETESQVCTYCLALKPQQIIEVDEAGVAGHYYYNEDSNDIIAIGISENCTPIIAGTVTAHNEAERPSFQSIESCGAFIGYLNPNQTFDLIGSLEIGDYAIPVGKIIVSEGNAYMVCNILDVASGINKVYVAKFIANGL